MSPTEYADVVQQHQIKSLQGGPHASVAAAIQEVELRGRKGTWCGLAGPNHSPSDYETWYRVVNAWHDNVLLTQFALHCLENDQSLCCTYRPYGTALHLSAIWYCAVCSSSLPVYSACDDGMDVHGCSLKCAVHSRTAFDSCIVIVFGCADMCFDASLSSLPVARKAGMANTNQRKTAAAAMATHFLNYNTVEMVRAFPWHVVAMCFTVVGMV